MVFLPKKASGEVNGVEYYLPADTRPLSIVNTDNRVLASAVRLAIEPALDAVVSEAQQGFLPGRSLIKNVLDIDEAMRNFALAEGRPAAIFYDFKAAFPSISQSFLLNTLKHLGIPEHVICFIKSLYHRNSCVLSVGGSTFKGFDIGAGIRQGCPLSPLLFAVVADILLRRLGARVPSIRRAYADDLAMVVSDFPGNAKLLMSIFADYEAISGLQLNMSKINIIPLWFPGAYCPAKETIIGPLLSREEKIKRAVAELEKGWTGACFCSKAEYLGFWLGPDAGGCSWEKVKAKALKKAELWSKIGCSLHYAALIYNTYVLPTMSFIMQLYEIPEDWQNTEEVIMRRLVPGPWKWAGPKEFRQLASSFGMPTNFGDLCSTAAASKVRVAHREAARVGGLNVPRRWRRLQYAIRESVSPCAPRVFACWGAWLEHPFCRSFVEATSLVRNKEGAELSKLDIEKIIAKGEPRPWRRCTERRVKSRFQATCREMLEKRPTGYHEKMCRELRKWNLPVYDRTVTDRAFRLLDHIKGDVPPRATAALLRSWWDGWTTSARMHEPGGILACYFCGEEKGDKLGHYCQCKALQGWRSKVFGLPWLAGGDRKLQFFILEKHHYRGCRTTLAECLALATTYHAFNSIKHFRHSISPAEAVETLSQSAKELAMGHPRLEAIVDGIPEESLRPYGFGLDRQVGASKGKGKGRAQMSNNARTPSLGSPAKGKGKRAEAAHKVRGKGGRKRHNDNKSEVEKEQGKQGRKSRKRS